MGQVIKSFLGIFFAFLVVITGVTVVTAQMQVSEARSFKDAAVAAMENSDFNGEVINACFAGADELGYRLEVTVYGKNGGSSSFTGPGAGGAAVKDAASARVFLTYDVSIYGQTFEKSVQGTAK